MLYLILCEPASKIVKGMVVVVRVRNGYRRLPSPCSFKLGVYPHSPRRAASQVSRTANQSREMENYSKLEKTGEGSDCSRDFAQNAL